MIREEDYWMPWYDAEEAARDVQFADALLADDIELSSRAKRKLGDNLIALARAIRWVQRKDGSTEGRARVGGRRYYFEVVRPKLTPAIDPSAPWDPDNFLRTVSVCTKKELKRNMPLIPQRRAPEPAPSSRKK